jgi:hypothetical protein
MNRLAVLAALLTTLVAAAPAAAIDRDLTRITQLPAGTGVGDAFVGVSDDGKVIVLQTDDPLTAADGDFSDDIYVIAGGSLKLVSDTTPAGADPELDASFREISADGSHVLFRTSDALVAADGDSQARDAYDFTGGQLVLVSDRIQPGADANESSDVSAMSADGSRIILRSDEALVAEDGDSESDVYVRAGGETKLLSDRVQAGADEDTVATVAGISEDARHVVVSIQEPLVAADTDTKADLYKTSDTGTGPLEPVLVSDRVRAGADEETGVTFGSISADGSTVVFETPESLVVADGDASADVYRHRSGAVSIVSDRRRFGSDAESASDTGRAVSDGGTIYFESAEQLVAEDDDNRHDVYAAAGGDLVIASDDAPANADDDKNSFIKGIDGQTAVVSTNEPLSPDDTDVFVDLYRVGDGLPRLVSDNADPATDAPVEASFELAKGGRVVFRTEEAIVPADTDASDDLYEHDGEGLVLVSGRRAAGPDADTRAELLGFGRDGRALVLGTADSLVQDDTDSTLDAYLSFPAVPGPPGGGPAPGGTGPVPGPGPGPGPAAVPPAPVADKIAPGIGALSLSPKRVTAGKQATISFTLTEPARVTLAFARREAGRRDGRSCKKPSRRNRKGKKCTRLVKAGSVAVTGKAGRNTAKTPKRLSVGSYEITATATDAAGNKAAARKLKFTVVKKKRKR